MLIHTYIIMVISISEIIASEFLVIKKKKITTEAASESIWLNSEFF